MTAKANLRIDMQIIMKLGIGNKMHRVNFIA